MDLGFGAVFKMFEEYFGRRVTMALLILVGLAIAAACLGTVWTWIVVPMLAFFRTPIWGQTLASLAFMGVVIGAGIAVGLALVSSLLRWKRVRELKRTLRTARAEKEAMTTELKALSSEQAAWQKSTND